MQMDKDKLWIDFIREMQKDLKTSVIYSLKNLNGTITNKPYNPSKKKYDKKKTLQSAPKT